MTSGMSSGFDRDSERERGEKTSFERRQTPLNTVI